MDEGLRTSILTLRHTVRVEAMRPVITIARERLRDEIELHALGLPKKHANCASFILTCNLLADVVMRHQRAFEREGLPKDTARRLREGAAKRATARASRAMWRRKIDDQLLRARGDLAVLDVSVRAALKTNRPLAAEWATTKRATGPVEPEYRVHKSA